MTLYVLPPELYRDIFCFITSKHDLFSLSLVSRGVQPDAEYFLYNHLSSDRRSLTRRLCDVLVSTPRLQSVVRSLSISDSSFETETIPGGEDYWDCVAQLLRYLHRLEELKIFDGIENDNARVLSGCVAKLKKAHIDFTLNAALVDFLCGQSNLQELSWTNGDFRMEDTTILSLIRSGNPQFSNLEELTTSSHAFALGVIQIRCPPRLWISGRGPSTGEQWVRYLDDCGQNLESLISLRVNLPIQRGTCIVVLATLANYAPNLRSLGFLPHFAEEHEEMFAILAEFKQLTSVVTWSVISSNTCHKLATRCPSLKLIACLHYSYLHEYVFLPVNPIGQPRPVHDPDYRLWRDA